MEARQYQKTEGNLDDLMTGKFELKQEHYEAFKELKNMLSSYTVQAYFDPKVEHGPHTSGCPLVLLESGAVCQSQPHWPGEAAQLAGAFERKKFHLPLWKTLEDGARPQASSKCVQKTHSYILDPGPKDRQSYAGLRLGSQVAFKGRKHTRLHIKTPCANRRVLQVRIEND